MKPLFICFLFIYTLQPKCQVEHSMEQVKDVFLDAIHLDIFAKEFKLCKLECNQVNIFDYNNQIRDFPVSTEICSKKVAVYNTTCVDHPTPSSIVVYKIEVTKEMIQIYFFRPYSGASIIFSYQVGGKKIKLQNTQIGTF